MRPANIDLLPGYWEKWITVNHTAAIYHQWEQLEASGCIDNFRILTGEKQGSRQGWFFADSDAYKWLDAASGIQTHHPSPRLEKLMDDFILLLEKAQAQDGYLYTYNQIHFPGTRWVNLQIEHELYCHGHLIEAGVSHFNAFGNSRLFAIARKAADRIVSDFQDKSPSHTPGHEEIEIALLRLYEITWHQPYLKLAHQFLQSRGRTKPFFPQVVRQYFSVEKRTQFVQHQQQEIAKKVPPGNAAKKPPLIQLRWFLNALSGKYFQQHQPLHRQTIPVGHAVRFAYLVTAAAMFDRISGSNTYLPALERSWLRMVNRRMYITGGIGSLPILEGFGRDYELDPEYAYAETCAALGSLFWNREMAQLTHQSIYSDLSEWQMYNAAMTGMGQNGQCYFYNNPLAAHGGIQRWEWYEIPCCPSNLSRFLASLPDLIADTSENTLEIHQYISSRMTIVNKKHQDEIYLQMDSGFPWTGQIHCHLLMDHPMPVTVKFRIPSWSTTTRIRINGQSETEILHPLTTNISPVQSEWLTLERMWQNGDTIDLSFDMSIRFLQAHPSVKKHRGKIAIARGPLIYCLESIDQPEVNIFQTTLDPASLQVKEDGDMLNGIWIIRGKSTSGQPLTFIPYHLWGNRGESCMTVWVNGMNYHERKSHANPMDT